MLMQCWLKKQKDAMQPDQQEEGKKVSWTSGIIFGKGEVYWFDEYCCMLFVLTMR